MRRADPSRLYALLSVASTFANATMFAVATVYYVRDAAMNPLQLVLAGTCMEIAIFVLQVPTGAFADVYGRHRSVILGTAIAGAAGIWIGLLPSFGGVAAGLVLWGIGDTFVSGAREAWINAAIGPEASGALFVRVAQWRQLAGVGGTAASAALAGIALRLPLLCGGALTVTLALFLSFAMGATGADAPEPSPAAGPAPDGGRAPVRRALAELSRSVRQAARTVAAEPALRALLGVAGLGGAASEGWDRLWQAYLLLHFRFPRVGSAAPVVWIGAIEVAGQLLAAGLFAAFAAPLRRALRSVAATARALAALQLAAVAGAAGFGLLRAFAPGVAAVLCKSAATGLAQPLQEAWLVQVTDGPAQATALSLAGQADALGQWAGGPVLGAIATWWSLRAAMCGVAVALAPAAGLLAAAARRAGARPTRTAVDV